MNFVGFVALILKLFCEKFYQEVQNILNSVKSLYLQRIFLIECLSTNLLLFPTYC